MCVVPGTLTRWGSPNAHRPYASSVWEQLFLIPAALSPVLLPPPKGETWVESSRAKRATSSDKGLSFPALRIGPKYIHMQHIPRVGVGMNEPLLLVRECRKLARLSSALNRAHTWIASILKIPRSDYWCQANKKPWQPAQIQHLVYLWFNLLSPMIYLFHVCHKHIIF